MNRGDIVKYSKPRTDFERTCRFILLGLGFGRADIQLICDYQIKPIETVAADEIEPCLERVELSSITSPEDWKD